MTLIITIFAAVAFTLAWYLTPKRAELKLSVPMFMFWGASIMWTVDAVAEYIELGVAYFTPQAEDLINDTLLGLSVVALGTVIWVIVLLIKDPKGVVFKR